MPFPDLVWTAGGIVGGLLLIDSIGLNTRGKVGIWIIFASFLFQVYWEITHPWSRETSLSQIIVVTVILVVGLLYMWARLRAKKSKA